MSLSGVSTKRDDEAISGTGVRLPRPDCVGTRNDKTGRSRNDTPSRHCEAGGASRSNLEDCQASLRMGIYAKNAVTQLSK